MAVSAGRLAEVLVSSDGVVYVDVERVLSPRVIGANATAETSSNDSANADREIIATWGQLVVTFEMVADESGAGQEMLWTAFLAKASVYVRVVMTGDVAAGIALTFRALVTSIGQDSELRDASRYRVQLDRSDDVATTRVAPPVAPPGIAPLPAPYLYWTMDAAEISGTAVLSLPPGSGNPATYEGGVPMAPGQNVAPVAGSLPGKTALAFDGVAPNSNLRLGATLDLGTGDFTLFCHLFVPVGVGFSYAFTSWEITDGGHQLLFGGGAGGVYFAVSTDFSPDNGVGAYLGTDAVTEGAFHDIGVVVRRGAGTATGWLDGVVGASPLDISSLAGQSFTFPNTAAAWPRFGARVGSPVAPFADVYRPQRLAEFYIARSALSDVKMADAHALRVEGTAIKVNQGYP